MKQFNAFVVKEFYHIIRDKRTVMILLVMPIIQMLLFGFAITTEIRSVRVGILNPSNDIITQEIIDKFNSSEYFEVVCNIGNLNEIEEAFQSNQVDFVVAFEENFYENLHHIGVGNVQFIADATDVNSATMITNYATGIINIYQQQKLSQTMSPIQIVPQIRMLYNPQMESSYTFVPGVMGLILMLICAMMTSISIVRERERGTMEILLVSPMKPIFIVLAKLVPYFVLSCVNLITILLLSVYVLEVPIAGSLFWLSVVSLIFIITSLSLGLLISNIVESQLAAMLASGMVLMMPTMLLSGMMFPIESMPEVLQYLSCIIPARWYISAVKKIMIQGVDIQYAMNELLILVGMTVFLIGVGVSRFKNRL